MKRTLRLIVYILLIILIPLGSWVLMPASVHYHLTEHYLFTSAREETSVALAVILPVIGPYQEVKNAQIFWNNEPTALLVLGEARLQDKVKPGKNLDIAIQYDVVLRQGPASWIAPREDFQLQPSEGIESDQAALTEQARQLVNGTSRAEVYDLFTFTAAYLSWPEGTRLGNNQSALSAYQTGVGGCGEFANLMVALSRAARIPAQSITGLALPAYPPFWSATRTWNHPGGAHAWAEVYTGDRWELVDPSWGSYYPGLLKGLWFGRTDGSHLSYGETAQYQRSYQELTSWAEEHGTLIGAMSNPLHFVAAADKEGVTVIPSVTLHKGWDGRWVNTVSLYVILLVGFRLVEKRVAKSKKINQSSGLQ